MLSGPFRAPSFFQLSLVPSALKSPQYAASISLLENKDPVILGDPGADKVGARESLNGRKNKARRKAKNGEKRLSLAPTICPWVSEDGTRWMH